MKDQLLQIETKFWRMSLSFNFVFLRCRTEDFQRTAQEQLFKYLLLSWTLVPDRSAKLHVRGLCHQDICFPAFLKLIFIIYFSLKVPLFWPLWLLVCKLMLFYFSLFFFFNSRKPQKFTWHWAHSSSSLMGTGRIFWENYDFSIAFNISRTQWPFPYIEWHISKAKDSPLV